MRGGRGSRLLVALFFTLSLNAQVVEVYKAGNILYSCNAADSIVFRSMPKDVFSVSATKLVRFSKGNLQYTQSTQIWSFADNQYDMIGDDNVSNGGLADKIDMFGWSGSTATAQWGISTSEDCSDYSGDFVDWGKNIGDGNTWYTLTYDEWGYLISGRTNANNLIGVARINLNADGSRHANGIVFLPDYWICPAGITFKSGYSYDYVNYQIFTLSDWQKLEVAGAVFLPASGYRGGSNVNRVQECAVYWSATVNFSDEAGCLYFDFGADAYPFYNSRDYGQAVRLVQDL